MTPAGAAAMVVVGPMTYRPPATTDGEERALLVSAFRLDATPVTNAQFLEFVRAHDAWQRDRAPVALADASYLSAWAAPTTLGASVTPDGPVTSVSWFAAEAYCEARGATLPTVAQWEVAASGPENRTDPERTKRVLDWYAVPNPARLPPVGRSAANGWGIHDMDDLVWEWVLDFNETVDSGAKYCGGASLGAVDPADVATSLRYEMRASLRAAYTAPNLGFRCASPLP